MFRKYCNHFNIAAGFFFVAFWGCFFCLNFATASLCSPGAVSGCKVCDNSGSAWVDDDSKCLAGQACLFGSCVTDTGTSDNANEALVVSELSPSGTIYGANTNLLATTNKPAYCRYDTSDKDFDSMLFAFSTADYLDHVAAIKVPSAGAYVYYVRCRDNSGKSNSPAGVISFSYSYGAYAASGISGKAQSKEINEGEKIITTSTDLKPPVISRLSPFGEINQDKLIISCVTDEPAVCKYDSSDTDYDSMKNFMESSGTSHSQTINLRDVGVYNYYIRCRDENGNKNLRSAQINFSYFSSQFENAPKIFNLLPSGMIYQEDILLTLTTDRQAECRYDLNNVEFDKMSGKFESDEGVDHRAAVSLDSAGNYIYYVRCQGDDKKYGDRLGLLSFKYINPDSDGSGNAIVSAAPIECTEYIMDEPDGKCSVTQDCLCDPDCDENEAANDSDCANFEIQESKKTINISPEGVAAALFGSLAAIFLIAIISAIKGTIKGSENTGDLF